LSEKFNLGSAVSASGTAEATDAERQILSQKYSLGWLLAVKWKGRDYWQGIKNLYQSPSFL
jgi:hypothetical protein